MMILKIIRKHNYLTNHCTDMTKSEIQQQLSIRHQAFAEAILSLSEADFLFAKPNKWTAGEQLEHIYRAVKPVTLAFVLPKFVPRLLFGKVNRPSKNYEALVSKYQEKLAAGGKASGPYIPKAVLFIQRNKLKTKLLRSVEKLNKNLNKYSEAELDSYILPHPLLGKITLREMMYFTIYHVEHHHKAIQIGLK
jgi:hypothetical protein